MLSSVSGNNAVSGYTGSTNNNKVNIIMQELSNLFHGRKGINSGIKNLRELIKNATRDKDRPDRINIKNSEITYIDIGSYNNNYITVGVLSQEPQKIAANDENKELLRSFIRNNIVEDNYYIRLDEKKLFSAIKDIYDEDPNFVFRMILDHLSPITIKSEENGICKVKKLLAWYGKDNKNKNFGIVIENKNGNDYLSLGYYDKNDYHIQRGIRIDGDNITRYCSYSIRNCHDYPMSDSDKLALSYAQIAPSFTTGINYQVVNELNGERLREPNEVFKRLGHAIRNEIEKQKTGYDLDIVKKNNNYLEVMGINHTTINVDHYGKDYFNNLEIQLENRLLSKKNESLMEMKQLSSLGVKFDEE